MIRFEGVSKRFGDQWAVKDLSLEVAAGEFFALLGPSGSGKSTLMRLLAGFETPDAGRVLLEGVDLAGRPPHLRPVNLMFQSYALFPHLTVAGNVAYGLRQEKLRKGEIAARVEEMLALVRLEALAGRKPGQLSGGQRQRTALARALAKRPRVLLLDEPLGALDRRLRETTRAELKAIQARLGTTFLMVTHDQDEAMGLADRMALMRDGTIVQVGPPRALYAAPTDRWAAEFLGEVNLIPCDGGWRAVRPETVGLGALPPLGEVPRAAGGRGLQGATDNVGQPRALQAPPPDFVWSPSPKEGEELRGRITQATYLGDRTAYLVDVDGSELKAVQVNYGAPLAVGDAVRVELPADAPVVAR